MVDIFCRIFTSVISFFHSLSLTEKLLKMFYMLKQTVCQGQNDLLCVILLTFYRSASRNLVCSLTLMELLYEAKKSFSPCLNHSRNWLTKMGCLECPLSLSLTLEMPSDMKEQFSSPSGLGLRYKLNHGFLLH